MEQKCELCDKCIKNFLEHLFFEHKIENAEEYEEAIKNKTIELEKTKQYQQRVRELANKLSLKQITPEEYRGQIVNIKRE